MPLDSTYTAESLAVFFFFFYKPLMEKIPYPSNSNKEKVLAKRQSQRRYLALKTSGASDKNYTIASCLYMYIVC